MVSLQLHSQSYPPTPSIDGTSRNVVHKFNIETAPIPLSTCTVDEGTAVIQHHQPEIAWDEGVKAWCTIAGGWLAMFATFGYQNSFGVFQSFYLQHGAASTSAISWIGSIQFFLITSMGLFSGKLVDLGYFRHTLATGSILYIISLFMLSISHPSKYYQILLSQGVGMGLGGGMIYIPSLAVQSHWWHTKHSMAIGIVFSGSALGGIVLPIMLNKLLNSSTGFPWSVQASAILCLVCLLSANLLMHPRPELAQPNVNSAPSLRMLFNDAPYVLFMIGAFVALTSIYFSYFYIQVFAQNHGIPESVTFYTLAVLNAGSIPGRIVPNILAPNVGILNLVIIAGIGNAGAIFALFGTHTVAGVMIVAILSGFFTGAFLSLLAAAVRLFVNSQNEVGIRMGLAFAFGATGALIGTPIDGILLGGNFSWSKPLIFSGAMSLFGTVLLAVSRQLLSQKKNTVWI